MEILRTPDSQFDNLPDYDFEPHYVTLKNGLRIHYVDTATLNGQKDVLDDAPVILMMHGEPSWSFLYRHMIKNVAASGFRVIAPDLVGFGRSDKPYNTQDYSYSRHVAWMSEWFEAMKLKDVVLFCQDWGGLIGLRLVAKYGDKFSGVIAANTFLPTGDRKPGEAFLQWQKFSKTVPEFPVGGVIRGATVKPLGNGVEAAYNAPFPDESYKAGARIFPSLVPTSPDMEGAADNVKAWKVLSKFSKPFLTAFSDQDPVTKGGDRVFQKIVAGCAGQPHTIIKGGGHFLQEDAHQELSEIIVDFMARL